MKKNNIILISIFVLSCNPKTNRYNNLGTTSNINSEKTENLDWLTGNWIRINEKPGRSTFENWEKINSSEYSGFGFTMQDSDTVSQEKMDIIQTNGKWALFVKLPNAKDAIKFEITEFDNNGFVCFNYSNDFPNRIQYWMEGDKVNAKISNSEMEIPFVFEKIK